DLYELIDSTYTTDDTFVVAFGKFMTALTKEFGLVFFSPGDLEVKRMAAGFFKSILNKQDELHQRFVDTNFKIKKEGYHIQVEKKDNATHLFYNLNGRTPVLRDNNHFTVGGEHFSIEELCDCIDNHPERFSPDVMTRPILQSFLFPVVSQLGGASEIAYLAQTNQIFNLFDRVTPFYKARPSITILEKRFEKLMTEHDIKFEEIAKDIEQVINRILSKTFPEDIETNFDGLRKQIKSHFEKFSSKTLEFDPALMSFAKQTLGKIDFSLKAFEGKVFSAHKKKSKESRERIYRLWHSVYPNRNFQERAINISYFLSKYGLNIIKYLYENIDTEEKAHQIIHLKDIKE
ncbi:MAG: bacillithiol biosynthesis cysteine-adding enzyme BshC, partial [Candidatus Zixiibacteriota bacterium]